MILFWKHQQNAASPIIQEMMMKLSKMLREEHVIDGSQTYQEWQKF